jgi:hypothetical protein
MQQIKLSVFNLENVTSNTILSSLSAEVENSSPDFIVFTNVWMEPYFPKALIKLMKNKKYVTDHYLPLTGLGTTKSPAGSRSNAREILFRKITILLSEKVIDTHFDKSTFGFRTYRYLFPTQIINTPRPVIIKTFTLSPEVEAYQRSEQINHILVGDTNYEVPEIVISDFRFADWETFPTPEGWNDLHDLVGTEKEDANYGPSRRDRILYRDETASAEKLTSVEFMDPQNKLVGEKKMTIGVVSFLS